MAGTPEQDSTDGPDDAEVSGTSTEPDNGLVGPTLFPDNRRRRIPGIFYLIIGVGLIVVWVIRRSPDPVFVNGGYLLAAAILIIVGVYCLLSGWGLDVDEEAALASVAAVCGHPMGHASAQMAWRGWTSRPTWRILWYSAEDPPRYRGLAFVDGHDGRVLDSLVEENPEDWGDLDGRLDRIS